jgi:predicted protein tyrosine phosphatase
MPRWVIESRLARCHRPGFDDPGPGEPVSAADVDRWLEQVGRLGIRSILCILARQQLARFAALPGGLIAYYHAAGLQAEMIEAEDDQYPPLDPAQLEAVWSAYQRLPEPVLVHCGAGVNRTGAAVAHIQECLRRTRTDVLP